MWAVLRALFGENRRTQLLHTMGKSISDVAERMKAANANLVDPSEDAAKSMGELKISESHVPSSLISFHFNFFFVLMIEIV
jgi:hypothetical protein